MNKKEALSVFGMEKWEKMNSSDLKFLYRGLAKKLHPDKEGGDKDGFIKLQNAFEFLIKKTDDKIPSKIKKDDEKTKDEDLSEKKNNKTPKNQEKEESEVRDIKALDKNEILDKYYEVEKQLDLYQDTADKQKEEIDDAKNRVKLIIADFEDKKKLLKQELEERVSMLEQDYKGGFFKKIFFFLPKMSEDEFWRQYNEELQAYSKAHLEMDLEFFRKIVDVYGDGLNGIQSTLKDL